MLDVFFTFDVEVWCEGWNDIDAKFAKSFQKYIYGTTSKGNFGLPYKLKVLQENDLTGIFFVEPLFSGRFGLTPLAEIVTLVQEYHQEVQLHLHTEWVDEALAPLLDNVTRKRQFLHNFSLAEQTKLIETGAKLIKEVGGGDVNAFRAGNFGFNRDTLRALATNNIKIDSSYNATRFGLLSGVNQGSPLVDIMECEGVYEYPMTVFNDGLELRHAQVKACSHGEMEGLLWQALETGRDAFVILSHNFELLNSRMDRPDDIAVKRFNKLCTFLGNNKDCFRVRGFKGLSPVETLPHRMPLTSPLWKTSCRMVEQAIRRGYG
jgi:hypothetical protein